MVLDLPYSLIIEATAAPDIFGFYSPDLEGFTGIGHSIDDCISQARRGMKEFVGVLLQQGLPVPVRPKRTNIILHKQEDSTAT